MEKEKTVSCRWCLTGRKDRHAKDCPEVLYPVEEASKRVPNEQFVKSANPKSKDVDAGKDR